MAPRAGSSARRAALRPAPMTVFAPSSFAIWTAIRPALPVAARTRTFWPAWNVTRWRSATHEDMAGFIAAATATGSLDPGRTTLRRGSMMVCSAIAPIVVSGRMKYRRSPSGPRPTPSMPGTSGSSAVLV